MAADRSTKDKQMAAHLRAGGVTRRTGRCAACYRIIGVDSFGTGNAAGSRYKHLCPGGRRSR